MMKDHKKLVYGGQKGLDSHIARLAKSGWEVTKSWIATGRTGRKSTSQNLKSKRYDHRTAESRRERLVFSQGGDRTAWAEKG